MYPELQPPQERVTQGCCSISEEQDFLFYTVWGGSFSLSRCSFLSCSSQVGRELSWLLPSAWQSLIRGVGVFRGNQHIWNTKFSAHAGWFSAGYCLIPPGLCAAQAGG